MSGRAMIASEGPDMGRDDLESWIQSARMGDPEALGEALQSLREYLLLMARQGLSPELAAKDGASDLVQETFYRAHRKFGDYRGRSAEEWRGWLRSILVNYLVEHRRRYHGTASRHLRDEVSLDALDWPIESGDESPSRALVRHEREQSVIAALARLPEDYRNVILARHREKLTFDQIGRRRGISAEAARKLCERAIGRLRQELGPVDAWR